MQIGIEARGEDVAVIGGGGAQAFKIGDTAHAFRILSDTLYSDKINAVVREIICNATDAHVAVGKADVPIELTLSEKVFRVRDFGPGIADARMTEVYATYFGSTKQLDDAMTGGFGLGSKSPFAYTDHFMLTSCHEGMRSLYAAVVGDDHAGGAPALRLMGRTSTEDSGITVEVPIEAKDHARFAQCIAEVVDEGGILATLNGEILERRDYTTLKESGYGYLVKEWNQPRAEVLFGNVVYPLPDLNQIFDPSEAFLFKDLLIEHQVFILYAPPSSLVPTPSREALSLTPKTVTTLRKLLRRAQHEITHTAPRFRRERVLEIVKGVTRETYEQTVDVFAAICLARKEKGAGILAGAEAARLFADLAQGTLTFDEIELANRALKREKMCFPKDRGYYGLRPELGYDLRRLLLNRCTRVLVAAGVGAGVRYRHHSEGRLYYLSTYSRNLLARSKDGRIAKGDRVVARPHMVLLDTPGAVHQTGHAGFCLIRKEMSEAQVTALFAAAAKMNVQIHEVTLEKVERAPAIPKPGSKKFVGPLDIDAPFRSLMVPSRYASYALGRKRLVEADAQLFFKGGKAAAEWFNERPIRDDEFLSLIKELYPKTALVVGAREKEEADKLGIPGLFEIIERDVEARIAVANPEDNFAAFIIYIEHYLHYYGRVSNYHRWLPDILKLDFSIGAELMHYKGLKTAEFERSLKFWSLICYLRRGHDFEKLAKKHANPKMIMRLAKAHIGSLEPILNAIAEIKPEWAIDLLKKAMAEPATPTKPEDETENDDDE